MRAPDLRRPTLHRILATANSAGLTNALLRDQPTAEGLLQQTAVDNLQVLTSGPLPPNPAELLGSRHFALLLEDLKQRADVVLFDSPPVLAVTDAAMLARQMDGVLLVVDAGVTRRQWAVNALEALGKVNANILGVAINRLKPTGSGYYYYYHHYYSQDGDDATPPPTSRKGGGRRRRSRQETGQQGLKPTPSGQPAVVLNARQAAISPTIVEE